MASKIIEICEDIIFIQKEKTKLILNPLSIISTRHQKLPSGRGPVYMDTWARCNDLLQERIATLVKTSGMSVEEVFTEPTSGGYKMPLRIEWCKERKGWYFEKGKMETPTIGVDFDAKEAARQMAITLAEGKEAIDNLSKALKKEAKVIRVVNTRCMCGKVNIYHEGRKVGRYDLFLPSCCKEAKVETLSITREEFNELIKTAKGEGCIEKWDGIPNICVSTEKVVASEDSPECGA